MRIDTLPQPVMGWNSFDCWGIFINEAQALANLDAFLTKLKPHGYDYFCIDAGWYSEYGALLEPDNPAAADRIDVHIDAYGRLVPAPKLFPRGLRYIADRCHEAGIKFGVHLMRGIPRKAVEGNTPVLGADGIRAADIADTGDLCGWCPLNYGVDMTRPGAQAYYDSVIAYLSDELQIDLLKADDLADYPAEIEAIGKAIAKASRPIVYSLSPGDFVWTGNYGLIRQYCNMFRISGDIWDRPNDLTRILDRWEQWENCGDRSCCLDLDMIPFGALQVYSKSRNSSDNAALSGVGHSRMSELSAAEKRFFITQRALAASPLLFGGDLTLTGDEDIALATHPEILACCRNFVVGRKVYARYQLDVRKTPEQGNAGHGWFGIFNRHATPWQCTFQPADFGFERWPERLFSIWENKSYLPDRNGQLVIDFEPVMEVKFFRY